MTSSDVSLRVTEGNVACPAGQTGNPQFKASLRVTEGNVAIPSKQQIASHFVPRGRNDDNKNVIASPTKEDEAISPSKRHCEEARRSRGILFK